MDLQVIRNTIVDLENAENTFENCSKLASLYIIMSEAEKSKIDTKSSVTEDELQDIFPAYRNYVESKRNYQLNGTSEEQTVKALGFVCQEIYEFIQALYSSTDMPQERTHIRNLISKLQEIA
jgi:hypothetical protein